MSTLSIQVPDSLHQGIKSIAEKDGYSLNQFFVTAAAEKLAAMSTVDYLCERAKRADFKEFERILSLIPDAPPDAGDELP